eukprot:5725217-Alexandrium_andersonii.AAC.1
MHEWVFGKLPEHAPPDQPQLGLHQDARPHHPLRARVPLQGDAGGHRWATPNPRLSQSTCQSCASWLICNVVVALSFFHASTGRKEAWASLGPGLAR